MPLDNLTLNVSFLLLVILEGVEFGAVSVVKYYSYWISQIFCLIKYLVGSLKNRQLGPGASILLTFEQCGGYGR